MLKMADGGMLTWIRNWGMATKVLAPVVLVACASTAVVVYRTWHSTREEAIASSVANARGTVEQFKVIRSYYTSNVVQKIKAGSNVGVSHDHKEKANTIPLPATFIHDVGAEISQREGGVKLR